MSSMNGLDISVNWDDFGIFDLFDDGFFLWFTSLEYNALFKMDKRNNIIRYVGCFPDEDLFGYRLYTSINEYNGKLFFTPCAACEIGVYDMVNEKFEKINIGVSKFDNDITITKYKKKFVSGFFVKEKLVLIPCCYDRVIVYNTITGIVTEDNTLFEHFYIKYKDFAKTSDSNFYFCWFAKRISEQIIVFELHCNLNIIILYNLETGEFIEKRVGSSERSYSLIEYDGKYIFLYDEIADVIIRFEAQTNDYIECNIGTMLPEFKPYGTDHSFVNIAVLGSDLYLIPANTNVAVKFDILTWKAMTVDVLSDECMIPNNDIAYTNLCKVFNKKLYLFGNRSKEIILYEDGKKLQHIKLKILSDDSDMMRQRYFSYLIYNYSSLFDEKDISIDDFLKGIMWPVLQKNKHIIIEKDKTIRNCGCKIFELIKNI